VTPRAATRCRRYGASMSCEFPAIVRGFLTAMTTLSGRQNSHYQRSCGKSTLHADETACKLGGCQVMRPKRRESTRTRFYACIVEAIGPLRCLSFTQELVSAMLTCASEMPRIGQVRLCSTSYRRQGFPLMSESRMLIPRIACRSRLFFVGSGSVDGRCGASVS